ncbi:hypothetical protein VTN77DRAFT_3548 [Rasamsonia byssochlamydoides]|uniref:uncharacterized protein n=1 Tax=Rasamsonia byssochlamydoides TaxID=89139 RepID=UPI003743CEFE
MTAASPPVPPPFGENGLNGGVNGPMTMNMSRFHPIAINPNTSGAPAPPLPAPYRPYGAPMMEQQPPPQQQHPPPPHHLNPPPPPGHPPGHPPPGPSSSIPTQLEQIEARLRQIEQEEASRAAARAHILAMRKREDEEFRMITERAEAEEEELRRQRKRLKRESMGLTFDSQPDSPPRPMPRRLSETNAATALAFFKQQSPREPRPAPAPPIIQQPPPIMNVNVNSSVSSSNNTSISTGTGTFRKKQKYTIKNAEAWGERHGRPAAYDPAGRALWKRPSDGRLVYLDCPAPGCGKSDFVTLHGFMCHLTKKHKDRSLGSQSRALDLCGTVYDPNAPRPPRPSLNRGSTEDSRSGSVHTDPDGYQQEIEYSSASDGEDVQDHQIKKEEGSKAPEAHPDHSNDAAPVESPPRTNGSNKPTIAAMIDSNVRAESWRTSPPADVKGAQDQAAANGAEQTVGSDAVKESRE